MNIWLNRQVEDAKRSLERQQRDDTRHLEDKITQQAFEIEALKSRIAQLENKSNCSCNNG